jgi:hypothetical protein
MPLTYLGHDGAGPSGVAQVDIDKVNADEEESAAQSAHKQARKQAGTACESVVIS